MHRPTRSSIAASQLVLAMTIVVTMVLSVAAPAARADVWKFVDRNGVVGLCFTIQHPRHAPTGLVD